MSLEMCVLGSGSGGNSTLLRAPSGLVMIDAGFGPRTTAARLAGTGVRVEDIGTLCLTHLDSDHFNPNWLLTIVRQGIRIFCHENCVAEVLARAREFDGSAPLDGMMRRKREAVLPPIRELLSPFSDASFEPIPHVRLKPIGLAHDEQGSHGFLIQTREHRAGYATDLGRVPKVLIEQFCGVDFLAIESNYDPVMEEQSERPYYLKRRIMGGKGHLSNEQAFDAIQKILNQTEKTHGAKRLPQHIVLLHRSQQCNCPHLLRRLFERDERIKPVLTLAEQHTRTTWMTTNGTRLPVVTQLNMAWA